MQMPKGVPVATVAIGNAANAGLLALRILACSDSALQQKMLQYQVRPILLLICSLYCSFQVLSIGTKVLPLSVLPDHGIVNMAQHQYFPDLGFTCNYV